MLYNSVIMIWEKVGVIVMEDRYNGTVTAILEAGKKEFLTYGYEKASLRRIAKEASVTTGAIYGYFPGKKALFDALTSDKAMESLGHSAEGMSNTLIHILCRSFFQQLHEFVSHDLPREQAITCAVTLSRFQHAGWVRIMELGE